MLRRVFVSSLFCACLVAAVLTGAAQPDIATLGPQVGSRPPDFSGVDQFGRTQSLSTVLGSEGAMIVFFRSADW